MRIALLLTITGLALGGLILGWALTWRRPRHRHRLNIWKARQVISQLRRRKLSPAERLPIVLGTLRSLNPFQFEELILCCFQDKGYRIRRNRRYTGDGGIDGRVFQGEQLFLVQAKRYRHHINAAHVREFLMVINRERAAGGFFVHTGKTGKLSKQLLANSKLTLLSGQRLVDFVLHQ